MAKVKTYLLMFAAVCLAIMGARRYGEALGRKAEQDRQTADTLNQAREAHNVETETDRLSDDDVRQRLRDRWTR